MKFQPIVGLLFGLFYTTVICSQKSVDLNCQPSNGTFFQTSNETGMNYLLFRQSASTNVDTLLAWRYKVLLHSCSLLDTTAVFLSNDSHIGSSGYGLYIFKKQNNAWKNKDVIQLPHSNYYGKGVLDPGEKLFDEKYEFISHDILLQTTGVYEKSKTKGRIEYTVTKRFKIDYENLKIIPLE